MRTGWLGLIGRWWCPASCGCHGDRVYNITMSVPNLLGMLFVWYGVILLPQRNDNP